MFHRTGCLFSIFSLESKRNWSLCPIRWWSFFFSRAILPVRRHYDKSNFEFHSMFFWLLKFVLCWWIGGKNGRKNSRFEIQPSFSTFFLVPPFLSPCEPFYSLQSTIFTFLRTQFTRSDKTSSYLHLFYSSFEMARKRWKMKARICKKIILSYSGLFLLARFWDVVKFG